MTTIPENFLLLQQGEDVAWQKAIDIVRADENLLIHAAVIERTMDLLNFFIKRRHAANADEETIQLLGIRLFNGFASSWRLMSSGYFQNAAILLRDILETTFLLDYFEFNRTAITPWREATEKTLRDDYKAIKIRKTLDARDGNIEKRRLIHYRQLSELAAHPTYKGFEMLAATRGGARVCGGFMETTTLKALMEETAKLAMETGRIFRKFFDPVTQSEGAVTIRFLEIYGRWLEQFMGKSFEDNTLNHMRRYFESLPIDPPTAA